MPIDYLGSAERDVLAPFLFHRQEDFLAQVGQVTSDQILPTTEIWRRHRLTPLLYSEIARRGWQPLLPRKLLAEVRKDYASALKSILQEEAEISEVLQALETAGFDCILLKGADLRHRLYGDPVVRPMTDLDLLVAPAEVAKVAAFLTSSGYTPLLGLIDQWAGITSAFGPPPDRRLMVEVHDALRFEACYYVLPFAALSAAAVTLKRNGLQCKVLSPEHLIIHLCLHYLAHRAASQDPALIQVIDLAWTLERIPLDWGNFLQEVSRFRCAIPVLHAFQELGPLISPHIPPFVWETLRHYQPSRQERLVFALRDGLRRLSISIPQLQRLRPWWERVTLVLSSLRSRVKAR